MAPKTKGEITREWVLEQAARLFNERGFSGVSLTDLMEATGLEKGGLYHHFGSKEELAFEAFSYSIDRVTRRFETRLAGLQTAMEQLHALVDAFIEYYDDPPVPGGCPIMNTAVETDDANPRFRERARMAMKQYLNGIQSILAAGVRNGELQKEMNTEQAATVLLCLFEGALMLSKLNRDASYLKRAGEHMRAYIEQMRAL